MATLIPRDRHPAKPTLPAWRLRLVGVLLAGSALALVVRLIQIQVIEQRSYQELAKAEHWSRQPILGHRGTIRDRHGNALAIAVTTYSVYLDSQYRGSQEKKLAIARALAPQVKMSPEEIVAAWQSQAKGAILLKAGLPYQTGEKLAEADYGGVQVMAEGRRLYPEGNTAAPLLGFTGKDQQGLAGVEADFNQEMMGVPGEVIFERDSLGQPIPTGFREVKPPMAGGDLILTIDRFAQRLAEQKLDEAITNHQAIGGSIIVMDPNTGEILAMASRPSFDITKLDLVANSDQAQFRNRAVTDMYEPGSVFKVLTMAAALEEKLITPQTTFVDSGPVVRYGWTIDTWNGAHHGVESMTEVLQNSCNVGAVWVSDLLGPERFYKYVARFGFGQPTGVGLAGDAPGQVRTHNDEGWWPIDLSTNSFGQGISVTPLQMITSFAAVANGGNLMRPYVVKEAVSQGQRRVFEPVVVRRVISEEAAAQLRQMMNAAAEKGENKLAMVAGYQVAGKTGTASISQPGGYTSKYTIASFIGFAPYDDPRFVILVKIDEPKDQPWGSVVASPIFSAIAKELLIEAGIAPTEPTLALAKADRG